MDQVFCLVQDTLSLYCYMSHKMHARKVNTRTHLKLELSKCGRKKNWLQLRFGLLEGFRRCVENLVVFGWSIWIQLT